MYVTRLSLNNFRNYEDEKIEFDPGVNIVYGANGMGKTNALEAVYYFSQGRGLRGPGREAIRYGEERAGISLDFFRDGREYTGEIIFEKKTKKIYLNEIELKKTTQPCEGLAGGEAAVFGQLHNPPPSRLPFGPDEI